MRSLCLCLRLLACVCWCVCFITCLCVYLLGCLFVDRVVVAVVAFAVVLLALVVVNCGWQLLL